MKEPAIAHSRYPYLPLDTSVDTIRLLVLMPVADSKELHNIEIPPQCQLVHSTFANPQSYQALSYTWGKDEGQPKKTINLDGLNLTIRQNLYWALCYLRSTTRNVIMWVDAICIDQSNIEERNYQVGLVPFIYSRAQKVVIWLGPPKSSHRTEVERTLGHTVKNFSSSEHQRFIGADEGDKEELTGFEDMRYLVRLEYWKRAWIVQEVTLSRQLMVQYGSTSVAWREFMSCVKTLKASKSKTIVSTLDTNRRDRNASTNTLANLLVEFQSSKCYDARDRVYAFLGLALDCLDGSVQTDYSKSTTQVYLDLIKYFYRSFPGSEASERDGCAYREKHIVSFSNLVQKLFESDPVQPYSLDTKTNLDGIGSNGTILATGFLLGRIDSIGPTCQEIIESHRAERKWRLKLGQATESSDTQRELRESYEAYFPKIRDMTVDGFRKIRGISPQQWYSRVQMMGKSKRGREMQSHDPHTDIIQISDIHPNRDEIDSLSDDELHMRSKTRMFIGSEAFIGMTPDIAQVGDSICQFSDCPVTAVLRRDNNFMSERELWRIIGRVNLSTGTLDENMRPVYKPFWGKSSEHPITLSILMSVETLACLTA